MREGLSDGAEEHVKSGAGRFGYSHGARPKDAGESGYSRVAHPNDDGSKAYRYVEGINPVAESVRAGTRIEQLYVQKEFAKNNTESAGVPAETVKKNTKKFAGIIRDVSLRGAKVSFISKALLDKMSETGHHQGIIARCAPFEYSDTDAMLAYAKERDEDPFLILLDGVEDPQNLGAIIRTANVAGAHGVIIPKNRSAQVTPAAERAAAGAACHTPVARVVNAARTLEELKKKGIWCVCADMNGENMYTRDLTGPVCLVLGSEGSGVSRIVREACDFSVSIPMKGDINSLNVSVAAGVLSYEIERQRLMSRSKKT